MDAFTFTICLIIGVAVGYAVSDYVKLISVFIVGLIAAVGYLIYSTISDLVTFIRRKL